MHIEIYKYIFLLIYFSSLFSIPMFTYTLQKNFSSLFSMTSLIIPMFTFAKLTHTHTQKKKKKNHAKKKKKKNTSASTQHASIISSSSHCPLHLQDTGSPTTVLPSMPVAEVCIIISPSTQHATYLSTSQSLPTSSSRHRISNYCSTIHASCRSLHHHLTFNATLHRSRRSSRTCKTNSRVK